MITRNAVEARGLIGAGVVEETDEWYMVRILGNIPIYVRKDDESVGPHLRKEGFWESWITAWMLECVDENTMFVDIGANTGYYSILAKHAGAKVMAFEPNPQYTKMLRASIKIGWEQSRGDWMSGMHFNVYEMAVSNKVGRATLTIPSALQGSATITDADLSAHDPYSIEVITTTLDHSMVGIPKQPMLIKIDAEGAEELIWDGAQQVLTRQKPIIMLEYTPGAYGRDFLNKLERYGDLRWIGHDGRDYPITQSEIIAHTDWVMLVIRPREN